MNIAFFLTPKSEIIYLDIFSSVRQALEKMEYHRHSALPLIDHCGQYAGTLTEGDLLWYIKNKDHFDFSELEHIKLQDIPQRIKHTTASINADIEDLLALSINQNFIPIIDDHNIFIGIIRRRDIIEYYVKPKNHAAMHSMPSPFLLVGDYY